MSNKIKTYISIVGLIIALVLIFLAISSRQNNRLETKTIKIGAIASMTGAYASVGENTKKGIDLAVNEINKNGGVLGKPIEIVYQEYPGDDQKVAVTAFYKLVNSGVNLIIGPSLTSTGSALAPLAVSNKALLLSPAIGSEKFAEANENTFSVWPPDKNGVSKLAELVFNKGLKKVAVIGSQQEWERQMALYFKEDFEKLGGVVTDIELPLITDKDLRTQAFKIKESNPEAVIFTNYGETSYAAKRIHEVGIDVPFFSVLLDEGAISNANGALEGTIYVTSYTPTPEFVSAYKAFYNAEPQFPADTSYDSVMVLVKAIEDAKGIDAAKVVRKLSEISSFKGASGTFGFDATGAAVKTPAYYIVKNGKSELYK